MEYLHISKATGTVLIDEIDSHLHPEWQSSITASLRKMFPNLQFIVTTHSPLVIASAESGEVIRIPENNLRTLDLQPTELNYKGWQIEYILEDIMQVLGIKDLSSEIFKEIDNAYEKKDLQKFDSELQKLQSILHPKDAILKSYSIRRTNLLLKQPNLLANDIDNQK